MSGDVVCGRRRQVHWWKAERQDGVPASVPDAELRYRQINTGGANAPYTVNQEASGRAGVVLRSELVKNDVSRVDSGFYQCRLDLGGEFDRILVTVVDSASLTLSFSLAVSYTNDTAVSELVVSVAARFQFPRRGRTSSYLPIPILCRAAARICGRFDAYCL